MSYNKAYRITENDDHTKSIGPEIKLVGPGDPGFTDDALKEWANGQFLKLTGGTLTGDIIIRNSIIDSNVAPDESNAISTFAVQDKNEHYVGGLWVSKFINSNINMTRLWCTRDNWEHTAELQLCVTEDGKTYCTGPNPEEDAPLNALQTKKSVSDNFLAKTGGEMTGALTLKNPVMDATALPAQNLFNSIVGRDKDSREVSGFQNVYTPSGAMITRMLASSYGEDGSRVADAWLSLYAHKDGEKYVEFPSPRGLYNNDGVTYISMVNRCIGRHASTLIVYIDEVNGSDTADINNGRGLTTDKPFKTILSAFSWAANHYAGDFYIYFALLSDVTLTSTLFLSRCAVRGFGFTGIDAIRKITLNAKIIFGDTWGIISSNIHLYSNSNPTLINVEQGAVVNIYKPLQVSGTVTNAAFNVTDNSYLRTNDTSVTVTGTLTGKKYQVARCSTINVQGRGVNFFPGSEAGTVDETSTYM